jgi:hypothetical protein
MVSAKAVVLRRNEVRISQAPVGKLPHRSGQQRPVGRLTFSSGLQFLRFETPCGGAHSGEIGKGAVETCFRAEPRVESEAEHVALFGRRCQPVLDSGHTTAIDNCIEIFASTFVEAA